MTRTEIQSILQKEYTTEQWLQLLRTILPGTDVFQRPQRVEVESITARRVSHLANVRLSDGKQLAVLEVEVSERVDILRNRVGLRNFVSRFIDQERAHGVLAVFLSPEPDFRFTFAARESRLTEKGTLATGETATRRYTYVLGPNEPCRTPGERFAGLAAKGREATLGDVTDAFSVEKLNREFFDTYKAHYQKFCAHLLDSKAPAQIFDIALKGLDDKPRDLALKPVRDFVKKLLGRLVFLHFLQKKGWLGCPAGTAKWRDGDASFLKRLFESASPAEQRCFHSKRLVPLFFETLNRQRKGDIFSITGTRVPYLNGGLFERDFAKVEQIDFPAEYFRDLLEFFSHYNFTIDENDPDDHEIGIDPEMLGHIFENLLEDNKDKGAFYTPKAIVQYMCQQSLIYYLKQHLGDRPEIETLVRSKDLGDPHAKNNWVRENAKEIERLLDEVKICDPAIGSGAFPIGLLQEIYWLKLSLDWTLDRAKAKRDIIQHSIYGVDIDAGAVEIARLRFWLALVVEEDTPRPLPNLDYKIMQGNSLLESFEGIDLSNLTGKKKQAVQLLGTEQTELGLGVVSTELTIEFADGKQAEIGKLIDGYFDQDDHGKKQRLHREIDRLVLGHIEYNLDLHEERTRAVLDNARKELKRKQTAVRGYEPTKKEATRIAELEAQLGEVKRKRGELAKLQEKPERPFFLWHLFFQEVFAKGGFDLVIANPPYVSHATISEYRERLENYYTTAGSRADLFVFFYERSVKLLREHGVLAFITSNKYFRAAYGQKLRVFLTENLALRSLVDFGDAPVFEAIAYASILLGSKHEAPPKHVVCAHTWRVDDPVERIETILRERGIRLFQDELRSDGWRLELPVVLRFIEKLYRAGKPMRDAGYGHVHRGITTGLNEAFVVDKATRERLIAEHKSSAKLIKPYMRGRDVKRWSVEWDNLFIIAFPFGFHEQLEHYPAILGHLKKFEHQLKQRGQCTSSRDGKTEGQHHWVELDNNPKPSYLASFETPKIVSTKISLRPTFALDTSGAYLANTSYFFSASKDGPFLLGLLNSSVFFAYAKKVFVEKQGGWFEVQPDGLESFPIPAGSPAQREELSAIVNQIIAAKRVGNEAVVQSLEQEIDSLVFRLFALTPEEIALVQSITNAK